MFHFAAKSGSVDIFQLLLSCKNYNFDVQHHLIHSIYESIYYNSIEVFKLLLKIIDPNTLEDIKDNFLYKSIGTKSYKCFKFLMENGYHYKNTHNSMSILGYCAFNVFFPGIQYCVEKRNEIITAEVIKNALDRPYQSKSLVMYLFDRVSNEELNKRVDGTTIVHWVCQKGDLDLAKKIVPRVIDVNSISDGGTCALHFLKSSNEKDTQICDLLFEYGFDVNMKYLDRHKKEVTPLVQLVHSFGPSIQVIEWLLQHGAKTDVINNLSGQKETLMETITKRRDKKLINLFKKYQST